VVPSRSQQAGLLALIELDPAQAAEGNADRLGSAIDAIATGGIAPAARDDPQGRFRRGDAVGFAGGEIVAWGVPASTLAATIERLAEGAEIVTLIGGADAPLPLEEAAGCTPDGIEVEAHEGGQPSWWWLLGAQ
jgi:dihydroxyacetone kinase-like predicted kinase